MANNQSKFLSRVADAHLFTWGYLGFHVFAMISSRMFLNADSIIEYLWFWSGILVLEHVFIFSIYWLAKRYIKHYTATLVIVSSFVIGAVRTLITTSLGIWVGTDEGVAWGYQLLLGALYEVAMMAVWANVNGAYRDHLKLVRELNETRETILGYRENAEAMLAEEQEKLIQLTQKTLMPQIQMVEDALTKGETQMSARWSLANEIKGLINNQVRPLSESLRVSARALVNPAKSAPNQFFSVISIPRRFKIQNSLFPKLTAGTMALSYLATPFWVLDISWVIPSAFLIFTYYAVIYGFKRLFRDTPAVSAWVGVPVLVAIAIINVLPAYTAAVFFYPDTQDAVVYGLTLMWGSLIIMGSFAYLDSLDFEARKYRELLDEQNKELSREMALFEQQLWVARRNWSLTIHGTVQASLTAALTRLNAPDADKNTLALAKKDLDRAVAALSSPPSLDVKFAPAIKEIVATWQGVCDVEVQVDSASKKLVSKDPRLSMCVNEILKEAVSNAVRHGDARNAQASLKVADEGVLDLTITNDGSAPRIGGRKGIGSNLLDELTVDWSLGFDSATAQTILTARLPFSRSQA